MDDIRPPRNYGSTTPTGYGRSTPDVKPPINIANNVQPPATENVQATPADNYTLNNKKKPGKKTKILLVVFIILSLALSGFAAWQFTQVKDLQTQVDNLQKENDRLEERVYSLNYDNRDLKQQQEITDSENESLKELNQKLVDTCGSACATIIP